MSICGFAVGGEVESGDALLPRSRYCNLVVGFLWFVLSSRCGAHYGSHCGTRCASQCLLSGWRVSLMIVRYSGSRAVLTSLPQADVAVQLVCSRRARVVSSWLVVGFPGLRGVSCLHSTRLPGARMRRRDVPPKPATPTGWLSDRTSAQRRQHGLPPGGAAQPGEMPTPIAVWSVGHLAGRLVRARS